VVGQTDVDVNKLPSREIVMKRCVKEDCRSNGGRIGQTIPWTCPTIPRCRVILQAHEME
jgi:hypothetical protein